MMFLSHSCTYTRLTVICSWVGTQGHRRETLMPHCTVTCHKTMGKGEDADTWVSIRL